MILSIDDLTERDIAKAIDHSLLRPGLENAFVEHGCRLAAEYVVASVCVRPVDVRRAAAILALTDDGPPSDVAVRRRRYDVTFVHGLATNRGFRDSRGRLYGERPMLLPNEALEWDALDAIRSFQVQGKVCAHARSQRIHSGFQTVVIEEDNR